MLQNQFTGRSILFNSSQTINLSACILTFIATALFPLGILKASDTIYTKRCSNLVFFNSDVDSWEKRDTGITGLQIYQPFFKQGFTHSFLGNTGLAGVSYGYQPGSFLGFRLENEVYSPYVLSFDKMPVYQTLRPYTEVFFEQGSKKEQLINVLHTQNIKKAFNFGFNYNRITSVGFYGRQNTSLNNAAVFGHYLHPRQRFFSVNRILYNKLVAYENGGIASDSDFVNAGFSSKALLDINLLSAQNIRWQKGAFSHNSFHFGKVNGLDSGRFEYAWRIIGAFDLQIKNRKFLDDSPDKLYYRQFVYDSIYTNDSSYYSNWAAKLGLETSRYKTNGNIRRQLFGLNFKQEWINTRFYNRKLYNNKIIRYEQNNLLANNSLLEVYTEPASIYGRMLISGKLSFVLNGFNKGDYSLSMGCSQKAGSDGRIYLNLNQVVQKPYYLQMNYFANNIAWQVDSFLKPANTWFELGYTNAKYQLNGGIRYTLSDNFIYFTDSLLPVQNTHTQSLSTFYLTKTSTYKKMNWKLELMYNSTSFDPYRVAPFITKNSFFIQTYIFKKASLAQFGIDATYFSSFYGYSYSPELAQFVLNNQRKVGGYPYLDFFMNFKISTFRAFVKVEHLNAGLMGNTYYQFVNYPMHDRAIRLGILWTFHN